MYTGFHSGVSHGKITHGTREPVDIRDVALVDRYIPGETWGAGISGKEDG